MKYEVKMYRCEGKDIAVFAESPEDAVQMARADGWTVDCVTELREDDDGATFEVSGHCENCRSVLFDDSYRTDIEGVMFCKPCWSKLIASDDAASLCDELPECS